MADVFMLAGATLNLNTTDTVPVRYRERFGPIPTLTLQRRGIALPPEALDTWMGATLTWAASGTTYFSGRCRSRTPQFQDDLGWTVDYQFLGQRDYLDRFPHTDATTGLDMSPFNMQPEDTVNYNLAFAGRTVGQILTSVLTALINGAYMHGYGVGNLTAAGSIWALPASTIADLAALTVIPPRPVYFTGEKFGDAIDSFLTQYAPNIRCWVQPSDGALRFKDLRTFSATTLTMGVDPIDPTPISRDVGDCWQRLQVRGAPIAVMFLFKLSLGTLVELFAWGTHTTNALAIAAWTPAQFTGTASQQDYGNCTMTSTTTVVVTSASTSETYATDQWDQSGTGLHATINLYNTLTTGITAGWTSPVVANGALTAGGTATVTIAVAAPNTNYNNYTITGLTNNASLVWRQYQIADSSLWPLMVSQSTYPQPFINPGGAATLTSSPMGAVFWPLSGTNPPYNMFPLPFQMFPSTGTIVFSSPTYIVANNAAPADVWALIPINTGPNLVNSPQNSGSTPVFAGDSYTIEGLKDTLVITMADWRDPGQLAQVQAFADDYVSAVRDGRREGAVTYYGLWVPALTFGVALNIAGTADSGTADVTGWEAAAMPIVEVEVEWPQGASDYITTIMVSNRREPMQADMFLHPERTFMPLGLAPGSATAQIGGTTDVQHAYQDINSANNSNINSMMPSADSINQSMQDAGYGAATDHTGNATRDEGTATGGGVGNDVVGDAGASGLNSGMGDPQTSIGSPQAGMGNPQDGIGGQQQDMLSTRIQAQTQQREAEAQKKQQDAQNDQAIQDQGGN